MNRVLLFALLVAACSSSRDRASERDRGARTEVLFAFTATADPHRHVTVDPAEVRAAIRDSGTEVTDVAAVVQRVDGEDVPAVLVRVPYARPSPSAQESVIAALRARFADAILKATWSGERLFVRATQELPEADLRSLFDGTPLTVDAVKATREVPGEVDMIVTVAGPQVVYARAIERRVGGVVAVVLSAESIGPQSLE